MNSPSSWNIGDANLLIPVVENNDSLPSNVITEGLSENSELDNPSMAPTLLIGLNRNFLEQASCSKDIIFIQNSELKLPSEMHVDIPVNCDISGGYLIGLSFVDSAKLLNWQDVKNVRKSQKDTFDINSNSSIPNDIFSTAKNVDSECNLEATKEIFEAELTSVINEPLESVQQDELACIETDIEKSLPSSLVQKRQSSSIHYSSHLSDKEFCIGEKTSEQNLPLKKKAKMKGPDDASLVGKSFTTLLTTESNNETVSSEEKRKQEISIMKEIARKKRLRLAGKRSCCYSESELSEDELIQDKNWTSKLNLSEMETMNDIVSHLKAIEIVDEQFGNLILKGVSEMKTDIVQEMKTLSDSNKSLDHKFSYELLAFAFLLYFKNRVAYNFMSFSLGVATWPSIPDLQRWKMLVNSRPKPKKKAKKKKTTKP